QLEPLLVPRERFGVEPAHEIGEHDAMARIAADRGDVRHDFPNEGPSGNRDPDRSAPRMDERDVPQGRIGFGDLAANTLSDAGRSAGRVDLAAPEQKPAILC